MIKLENILFGYFRIKANFRKALQPFCTKFLPSAFFCMPVQVRHPLAASAHGKAARCPLPGKCLLVQARHPLAVSAHGKAARCPLPGKCLPVQARHPLAGLIAQKNVLCQITLSEDEAFPPRYHFCYRIVPVSLSCLPYMYSGHPVYTTV